MLLFILPLLFSVYICETCHQHGVLNPFAYYKKNPAILSTDELSPSQPSLLYIAKD